MQGWDKISDFQPEIVRFLINSYNKNRLVHAYILEGCRGVGKLSTAKTFAKMLLCNSEHKICNECRNCRMIDEDGHVNVYLIRPEGSSIKKEQIQLLQSEFAKTAVENAPKVYIIEEADKMSISAANSLLKFLEEPMANTYALLLTENRQMLLPTIRSRAIVLSFKSLSSQKLVERYEAIGIKQNASILSALTQNIDEGVKLMESGQLELLIHAVVKTEECFVKTQMEPTIILMQTPEVFKDKPLALLYLKIYMAYYQDVLNMKLGKTSYLAFRTYSSLLSMSEERNTINSCINKLQALLKAEKYLMSNANLMLCFDQLFLEMRGDVNYAV